MSSPEAHGKRIQGPKFLLFVLAGTASGSVDAEGTIIFFEPQLNACPRRMWALSHVMKSVDTHAFHAMGQRDVVALARPAANPFASWSVLASALNATGQSRVTLSPL